MKRLYLSGYSTIVVSFLLACILNFSVQAQDAGTTIVTSDFEGWASAGIKLKLHKKWTFELSEELRLRKNSTQIDQYFTNFQMGFAPIKFLEFGAGFRFMQFNDDENLGTYTPHYRLHFDAAVKHKIKRFSFKYRFRYQFRNEIGLTEEDDFKHRTRLKASVSYNIKKIPLEPKISVEIFNKFDKNDPLEFDKMRFVASLAYDLKKFGKIKLFYAVEPEITGNYPKTTGILGLGYTYTINIKKKKKK